MMRRFALITSIAMLPLTLGCGGDGLKLSKAVGTVTYKNQPLEGANVKFYPPTGPVAVGITDANGKFSMNTNGRAGANLGLNRVSITKMSSGSGAAQTNTAMTPEDMKNMAKANMKKADTGPKSLIPEKYGDADSGLLTADVSSDATQNDFVFDLQ